MGSFNIRVRRDRNSEIHVNYTTFSGAYTEIVIGGGSGVEVEVNLASAEAVIDLGGSGGMLPWKIFEISITNGAL